MANSATIVLLSSADVDDVLAAVKSKYGSYQNATRKSIENKIQASLEKDGYQWFVVRDTTGKCLAVGSYYENSPHVYWVRLTEYGDCSDFQLIARIVDFVKKSTQIDCDSCVFLALHDVDNGWF